MNTMYSKLAATVVVLWATFSVMYAQDSTQIAPLVTVSNPYLFNFSSGSLNSVFNEQLTPGTNNRLNLDFDYAANSNAAPFQFVAGILFGAPIKQQIIDRTHNRLKKQLRFEDQMKTGLTYRRHLKKFDGQLVVGYHHRQFRNLSAGKQAYELVFYGNAQFEDKTIDLSNINVQNFIYNQYSVGIFKEMAYPKYNMEFGVSGAFIQCANHQQIYTKQASLYTAPDGEYLDIKYDLTFNTGREGAVGFYQLNGAGASADFHFAVKQNGNWRVALDISDVGYFTFRKAPVNYSAAKEVRFQGIVIPDLLKFSAQTFDTLNLDSTIRSNLPGKSNNKYSTITPFNAQLVFSKSLLNQKLVINAGLHYKFIPNYFYAFAKANYFIKPDMVVSGSVGAGTYALCNVGAEFSKRWKYFDFTIGSSNLLGFIAPPLMPGGSLYLRLASSF